MKQPLISIITLNYNQTDVTCEFLESTKRLNYKNFETIVIDNASKEDPTERFLSGGYPNVQVIRCEENLGFTGGNNVGIKASKGDYVFIVNNDTEVTPDLLDKLLEPFAFDEAVGVVSPKIKFFHHPNVIQYAGFTGMNMFTCQNSTVGNKQEDKGQFDFMSTTHCAHGAAMLVKREVIEKVGMFAENFFIYYEEVDWSTRIIRAGYKIIYQGYATIYHKESITMGKQSAIKVYYHTRNRIYYMRRNAKKSQLVTFYAFFTLATVPKTTLNFLIKKQFEHLRSFFRGIAWNFQTSTISPQ
ncbi:glycosyltransferase family 2 protein [Danxiaibacter flavus]|jgi:GT2 family glycosyltransferase|uniref:Glycosyltransferase family 2 protein n=1 Tax=Danxiaibacter flavus TaxID=3049108 RepID=A0ABV3ZEJ6_9BACT|nr:glycosyltransferase family 2 protein [Chitinophagaceae bacterium DXS]